ncbi:GATA zinc finger domain containing 2Ab isoform X1 [Takifugu rubripes]|uniref:GATA zinc finger domain containing 2Ab n=1 Tax=Takifugu rubripes TaxID=31033 RepID=H2VAZ8_TAKRU|nr:transcriptional repressor p66-alpha isoform X1 [Takifugu rubripes]XP_029684657.1 transcriptional repressor p66-alpha isoform X1 [Takifugu rubripes]
MSEEVVRQTRSQKRALERDHASHSGSPGNNEGKRAKLERSDAAGAPGALGSPGAESVKLKSEQAAKVAASILKSGEVKATIKLELQTGDEPVDMSTSKSLIKKDRQPPSPDDVIVLSDNEPSSPLMNGHCLVKTDTDTLMKSSPEEREHTIKQLKEELRIQEAKLVLLKKLRQSQIQKESSVQKTSGSVATPPPLVRGSITSNKGSFQVVGRSSGTVIPPPLVRGGQHVQSKHNSQIVMPPLVRGAQHITMTAQQIASLRQQQQQHSGSGPPPLLLAPRASVPNVQVQGQRIIQQGLIRVANVANSNVVVNIPQASPTSLKGSSASPNSGINDSPASRQAAAKLALRKQLEKTLLEIPPPKPPAPDFNFLPSAANNEFIYLLGLEEVVQKLLEMHGRGNLGPAAATTGPSPKEPHTCNQCKTDFTSRWRKEKAGNILCDQCMSSNQKKALKAEHTSRLKAAFVKALQQEQEIDQHILQQAASSTSSASSVSKSSSSSSLSKSELLVSQQYKQVRAAMQHKSMAGHHSIKHSQLSHGLQSAASSHGLTPSFSSSPQLHSAMTAAALGGGPGKHAAARSLQQGSKVGGHGSVATWRKQSGSNTGVTMAYVNPSLSAHKTSSAVERQREYLLDMIPSRSISQTANTWK